MATGNAWTPGSLRVRWGWVLALGIPMIVSGVIGLCMSVTPSILAADESRLANQAPTRSAAGRDPARTCGRRKARAENAECGMPGVKNQA